MLHNIGVSRALATIDMDMDIKIIVVAQDAKGAMLGTFACVFLVVFFCAQKNTRIGRDLPQVTQIDGAAVLLVPSRDVAGQ